MRLRLAPLLAQRPTSNRPTKNKEQRGRGSSAIAIRQSSCDICIFICSKMIKPTVASQASWSLTFSGAGHLISYHLGVARTLQNSSKSVSIQSVAGSSSGAIVAAALTYIPHRLDEYTDRFLQDGGRAFANFNELLSDVDAPTNDQPQASNNRPTLHIATTRCSDGSLQLFSFQRNNLQMQRGRLLLALQASCKIPVSFHPWDAFSSQTPVYPNQDGVEVDRKFYVDGGISAPCPIVSTDNQTTNIVISPISGSSSEKWNIRPHDNSWKIPLVGDITARCGTFAVRPSVDNLRALVVSAGAAPPQVLKDWRDRGIDDANLFLEKWNKNQR